MSNERISLQEQIGKGYATFWNFKGDEVILMGSKGSKKSKTIAIRWMKLLKQYPKACLLAMRDTALTIKDSVFADLVWAAKKLKVYDEWKFTTNPMLAVNKITGQKIFFRGLDDWEKLASITIDDPDLVLCWGWFEEAFEIDKKDTYDKVKLSIRGKMPEGYFNQTVASFNPWNEQHFIVKELTSKLTPNEQILLEKGKQELIVEDEQEFEFKGEMVKEKVSQLLMITNYKLNEFLDVKDYARYEKKKKEDYEDYKTSGLGMPGVSKGLIFRNWRIEDTEKYKNTFELVRRGLDFGYSSDPSAFLQFNVDLKSKRIVVFDEFGAIELTNEMLANELKKRTEPYALIKADAAEPKSIAELNNLGINAIPAQKGPDSVLHGIKWLKGFEIIVDPKCKGLIEELGLYRWKVDKLDNPLNIPEDKNNHYIDALRYGSDDLYLRN